MSTALAQKSRLAGGGGGGELRHIFSDLNICGKIIIMGYGYYLSSSTPTYMTDLWVDKQNNHGGGGGNCPLEPCLINNNDRKDLSNHAPWFDTSPYLILWTQTIMWLISI